MDEDSAHGDWVAPAATGAILLGGLGQRMGGSKASTILGGKSLAAWVLEAVREAGLEPLIVAKRETSLPDLGAEVLIEPDEPRHPLTGIVAALDHVAAPIVVIAGDMPFVPSELISSLANTDARCAITVAPSGTQPLLARYTPEVRDILAGAAADGVPVRAVVALLHPTVITGVELARYGDPFQIEFNINTPDDLAIAELVAGGVTVPGSWSPRGPSGA